MNLETWLLYYKEPIYRLCRQLTKDAHEADDLFQETFLKAYSAQGRIAVDDKTVKNWLYTICINTYRDGYNKKKRWLKRLMPFYDTEAQDRALEKAVDSSADIEETVFKRASQEAVTAAVRALDEKYKIVVLLYYFEEVRLDEIAEILNIPVGTVKSRLHASKKQLKTLLERSAL